MTGWLIWILSFVCGLTVTEFVKGLFINLVSDILYDTGKLAVTFFKGNKEVEEQLKDCFYKAVDKNIKIDQISKNKIPISLFSESYSCDKSTLDRIYQANFQATM